LARIASSQTATAASNAGRRVHAALGVDLDQGTPALAFGAVHRGVAARRAERGGVGLARATVVRERRSPFAAILEVDRQQLLDVALEPPRLVQPGHARIGGARERQRVVVALLVERDLALDQLRRLGLERLPLAQERQRRIAIQLLDLRPPRGARVLALDAAESAHSAR
jgi:hypothetical protein